MEKPTINQGLADYLFLVSWGQYAQVYPIKNRNKYNNFWLAFVNIRAERGLGFNDLVYLGSDALKITYSGAWANIIVKAEEINEAIEIIPLGLKELNFKVIFIDKIENIGSLIEYQEINELVASEVNWLSESGYVFKISDKLFPYE